MLLTKGLRFKYDSFNQFKIPEIHLSGGDELLVLGKSGTGKSTLLNILGGLLPPDEGEVLVNGVSLYGLSGAEMDKFRSRHIGIVFQKPHLLMPLSVEENINLALYFGNNKGSNRVRELLEDLGLEGKARAKTQTLSEGEAQRVSIARALANRPSIILADEPTSSLDDENAQAVVKLLRSQAEKLNAILIIVTHDHRVKEHINTQLTMGGLS